MTQDTHQPTMADKLREEGFRQGVEKGIKKGQADYLLRQLETRFGPLPENISERVKNASLDDIGTWATRILDAATLEAVFEHASP